MSDTAAALLILPFLAVLVAALECGRLGCNHIVRRRRARATRPVAVAESLGDESDRGEVTPATARASR